MQGVQTHEALEALRPANQQERRMDFQYKSGDRPLDGYSIKRGIGWGGFGEVYYALSDSGKEVALKLVRRHLDVELRGVSQCINLKSPNLIAIFDVRENGSGESWIVMEYVSGPSLHQRLSQVNEALDYAEVRQWLDGIAFGVDYLHKCGIVHRDLKPGNIFLDEETVKIGDYGLSKFISASRRSNQTQSVGTVHYMAPEISTGNYGRSVDIYSTAIIAFEMLSGDVPFDGETPGEVLMKHLTAEPNLARVEERFRPLFAKALAKAPDARFGSARELVDAIDAVHHGKPIPVGTGGPSAPAFQIPRGPASPPIRPNADTPADRSDPMAETMATESRRQIELSLPPLPGTFASKRRELSTLFWQMFLAGFLSAILPLVAVTAWTALADEGHMHLDEYTLLTMMTGLSSMGLLSLGFAWQKGRTEGPARHMQGLLFGLVLGGMWFIAAGWLNQIEPSLMQGMTWHRLWKEDTLSALMPHLLYYLTLGGLTFAIPDWFGAIDPQRRTRVSLGPVIWPGIVAYALASVLGEIDAGLYAVSVGMIGLIVQWVSPHETFLARRRRQRRQFAGR